jgi:hypothetical protein
MFKRKPKEQTETEPQPRVKKLPNWLKISIFANVAFLAVAAAVFSGMAIIHQSDTNPLFCASCHNMQRHVDSYMNGTTMDAVHAKANVMCKDCHDYGIPAEIDSGIKFITGNYDESMPRRKFSQDMCTKCHISLEYHADRTDFLKRNPHFSHWPDLQCTTCHISHGEQIDYCSQCHDNGGQRLTGGEIIPRAENPWDDNTH